MDDTSGQQLGLDSGAADSLLLGVYHVVALATAVWVAGQVLRRWGPGTARVRQWCGVPSTPGTLTLGEDDLTQVARGTHDVVVELPAGHLRLRTNTNAGRKKPQATGLVLPCTVVASSDPDLVTARVLGNPARDTIHLCRERNCPLHGQRHILDPSIGVIGLRTMGTRGVITLP